MGQWFSAAKATIETVAKFEGEDVKIATLKNANGMEVEVINFGCVLRSVRLPCKSGPVDVILGYDKAEQYFDGKQNFSSLVGRFANRIAKGEFTLEGETYSLEKNNGPNHLHGGTESFHRKVYNVVKCFNGGDECGIVLNRKSPDGECGYPGDLLTTIRIVLTDKNELKMEFVGELEGEKSTIINLCNHGYWNLNGKGDVLDHELEVYAEKYTPVDDNMTITGEQKPVDGTPFDFRIKTKIGDRIDQAGRYDLNYCLQDSFSKNLKPAALLTASGRTMKIETNAPGIQVYTGNGINPEAKVWQGKNGASYPKYGAVCLETQNWPDSINNLDKGFPNCILKPKETYKHCITHTFTW